MIRAREGFGILGLIIIFAIATLMIGSSTDDDQLPAIVVDFPDPEPPHGCVSWYTHPPRCVSWAPCADYMRVSKARADQLLAQFGACLEHPRCVLRADELAALRYCEANP